MKIQYIFSETPCIHCHELLLANVEYIKSLPYEIDFKLVNLDELNHAEIYEIVNQYGYITIPMIIIGDEVVFRRYPSQKQLLKAIKLRRGKLCPKVNQEQIVLY